MVECGGLENRYPLLVGQRFESSLLRQMLKINTSKKGQTMNKIAQTIVVLITISLSIVSSLHAQDNAVAAAPAAEVPASTQEKLNDIRKLIVLTGGEELGKQMIIDIVGAFKENYPNVPKEFWDEFLNGNDAEKLIESNISVYDKHLSADEVKEIIKFYESPTGKKLIEVLPAISQESYASGEQWGYDLGKKVRDRLLEKGFMKEPVANNQGVTSSNEAAAPLEQTPVTNSETAEPPQPTPAQ